MIILIYYYDTPGGSPEAAADVIRVCRSYSQRFRVIVPNAAMSAGTLIAMGSDEIVMSDTSKPWAYLTLR